MDHRTLYVTCVLHHYRNLPGTLHRVLRQDRLLAEALHQRNVPLQLVEDAFLLAVARRTFCSDPATVEPVRSLRYFLPVIDELLHAPPPPGYLTSLRTKLAGTGFGESQATPPALGHHLDSTNASPHSGIRFTPPRGTP